MFRLERDYFFEFAGMPQGGKSTIARKLAYCLRRMGYPLEEYHGGSKHSLLYTAPIADLNRLLAYKAVNFTMKALGHEKEEHKIYLMNRGMIDRCIFTDALVRRGKVNKKDAEEIKTFLTLPYLLKRLDSVFIFVILPRIALRREYGDQPPDPRREVMNEYFLSDMYSIILNEYSKLEHFYMTNTQIMRTDWQDEQETFEFILNKVLNTLHGPVKLYDEAPNLTLSQIR